MKMNLVVFFLLFGAIYFQIPLFAEDECIIPSTLQEKTLLGERQVYFTYPSSDNLNLVLWYANVEGSYATDLIFPPSTFLQLNPTSTHIIAVEFENEYYLYGDEFYEHRGSKLNSIDVFDTSTMQSKALLFPEEWHDIVFVRRVRWIDNDRVMILSEPEHHIAGVINIDTGEFETRDWLNKLSFPYTPFPGGLMVVSPSGEYLYYTLADPFVSSIHWSLIPNFSVLPWTIINWDGEEFLDYRGGVGGIASWFDEESIITLDPDSFNLLRISLDGAVQRLTEDLEFLYYRYLASPNGAKVALTTEIDERDGFHQERLAILDIENGVVTHYCVDAIHIGKESWSSDGRLLVYVAQSISDSKEGTDLFVLDVASNYQISLLPERVQNDSVGSRFVRVAGFRD